MRCPLPPLAFLLLLALPAAASPAAPEATVPITQQQCFQIQYLLREPEMEALHFITAVKALRDMDANDEADTTQQIAALSDQAASLRREEAQAFTQLVPLLKSMGATDSVQGWASSEADQLNKPLAYTKDEQKTAKTEPQTAAILATLDEADALKTDTDNHLHDLALWLTLTRGPAGLWAADVGEVTAALHVAVTDGEVPRLAVSVARRLRGTAPHGTPTVVLDALGLLLPKAGGNLSGLVPMTAASIPASAVHQAHDALMTAFHGPPLTPETAASTH